MQTSGSYVVVEYMIRQKKIMLFELRHLVNSLERRGLITAKENQTLLKMGQKILPKLPTDVEHQPRVSTPIRNTP